MRISVVLPVLNRQALGERALRSAVAQGVDGTEIIVVDDGSEPPFELPSDIATKANVRLIRFDTNRGESVARNTGVGAAVAAWIAFLDSDDYWPANTLQARLECAELAWRNEPDRMILYVAAFVVDNKRTGRQSLRIPRESKSVVDFASGCWFAPGSTSLFRKETFDVVGPFDPMLPRLADLDWFLRFALQGGQVKVWDGLAAVVETGPKPRLSALESSARHLHAKYSKAGARPLAPQSLRRLDAYLDIERASIFAARGSWFKTLFYLGRSIWRVPRLTIHLECFWHYGALPASIEPAGSPDLVLR